MKRFLPALLVLLQPLGAARAYEADIHYSTTYVLARAVGWPEAEATTIASANQGVDENETTVAALEMDGAPGAPLANFVKSSLRQADKNLEFHCFSKHRSAAGGISADVRAVISRRFAAVPDDADADTDASEATRRLIALGVALHCQQDAFAHVDYGGACGAYAGSCFGHTHETILDQLAFRVIGRHYFNPDHPAVSGRRLGETLASTAAALAAARTQGGRHQIPAHELAALTTVLRSSGLDLPDETRLECNRYVAGKWLFDLLESAGRTQGMAANVETLMPEVAVACHDTSLMTAAIIRIPAPRFPRLTRDASPHLVRVDGSYATVRGGALEALAPGAPAARIAGSIPEHGARRVMVQVSHWRQLLALPGTGELAR